MNLRKRVAKLRSMGILCVCVCVYACGLACVWEVVHRWAGVEGDNHTGRKLEYASVEHPLVSSAFELMT